MAEHSGQSAAAGETRLVTLSKRYRAVAEADRRLGEALSAAHMAARTALDRLDRIEVEVEAAAADPHAFAADTAAGARALQRFLIGKQREIIAVVAEAADEAKLKTDALTELTDLYR